MTPFFEAARQGRNQFLVWGSTILIVIGASQLIGAIPLLTLMAIKGVTPAGQTIPFAAMGLGPAGGLALMLVPFIAGLAALLLCVRWIHQRSATTLIAATSVRWALLAKGVAIWFVFLSISLLIRLKCQPGNFTWNFQPDEFILLLVVVVVLIPLQTSFEELFFRGYLMQGIGLWTRRPWLAMIMVALLFGLLHGFNPEVKAHGMWLMMPQYIGLGLMLGWVTIETGGLEMALGIHAMNNVFSALMVTNADFALQTPALLVMHEMTPRYDLAELTVAIVLLVLIVRKRR